VLTKGEPPPGIRESAVGSLGSPLARRKMLAYSTSWRGPCWPWRRYAPRFASLSRAATSKRGICSTP
jgi:hypothetical protein